MTGETGETGDSGPDGNVGEPGDVGDVGDNGEDGDEGAEGDVGDAGAEGDEGEGGECGCEKRPVPCKSCDVHVVTRHSQTTEIPECPEGFKSLWSGYSLVMLEGNGYSLAQELGSAGSCLEEFQTVPMMQVCVT